MPLLLPPASFGVVVVVVVVVAVVVVVDSEKMKFLDSFDMQCNHFDIFSQYLSCMPLPNRP